MKSSTGEMPFLDHLEELRFRLLRSLIALAAGFGVGLWAVERFQLVTILKAPIAPYLENMGGRLAVLSPTEPVMIVLKLGFVVGLVLASPVILYQIWAFLSPALYERERRMVLPALLAGLVLFLTGALLGYLYLLPQALKVLFSFQSEALALVITYNEYFGFVLQIVLALGLSFELPLLIILLSALGVLTPAALHRFRRVAIILAFLAGALLSPGTDVFSMIMMTVPLLLLYEVGFLGSWIIERARRRRVAAALPLIAGLAVALGPRPASAQVAAPGAVAMPARDSAQDTSRTKSGPLDTATARRLGLPTAPARSFAAPDSLMEALIARPGYRVIRYRADSATLMAESRRIILDGEALTQRGTTILEADSITYQQSSCLISATGEPHLFDKDNVVIGNVISYDTCDRRGVVGHALTTFQEGGGQWWLRGNIAQDSSGARIYAGESEITSCDLPDPHYHFSAGKVKWISQSTLVARPAVLYVRDVPILWLPFVWQDTKPGRHSGILFPQFGINDIVRPTSGYERQVTNLGYYWVINDYLDLTFRLDWFSNSYLQYGVSGQYRWLNRFLDGSFGINRQEQDNGSSSLGFHWTHRQSFNLSTSVSLDLNYASNTTVVRENALDPLQSTQLIISQLNFSKRYRWGTLTIGGSRRQSLSDNTASTQLPTLTFSPKPIDISRNITWSPSFTLINDFNTNSPLPPVLVPAPGGGIDTLVPTLDLRSTAINVATPLRIGGFTWANSFTVADVDSTGRSTITFRVPDTSTPNPTDSVTVTQVFGGGFGTGINWDTGINLPTLLRNTWKVQPSLGIANVAAGPFWIRNRATNGAFVMQSKRFSFNLSTTPTFFGFYPGFGPVGRIRHSLSPVLSYNFSPPANVPQAYAAATTPPGQTPLLRSDQIQRISLGLTQNLEAKARQSAADSGNVEPRKFRLLSINTTPISYDFEQAKQPGRTGWQTQSLSNSFLSDLLPSFSLNVTHDLWRGVVGTDSATFAPFLQTITANFSITGRTFTGLGHLVGIGRHAPGSEPGAAVTPGGYPAGQSQPGPGTFFSPNNVLSRTGAGFTATFNYTLNRTRPIRGLAPLPSSQSLGFSTSFSPTAFWNVQWSTQYNFTTATFESQVLRLTRMLHDWTASFNVVSNPNGNFALYFSIGLNSLPELKLDYNQSTLSP